MVHRTPPAILTNRQGMPGKPNPSAQKRSLNRATADWSTCASTAGRGEDMDEEHDGANHGRFD
jgi:hypothetical protein